MLGPVAPEVPVLAELLVGLFFLAIVMFLIAVKYGYRYTFGGLLDALAHYVGFSFTLLGHHVRFHPLSFLKGFNHAVLATIDAGIASNQRTAGLFFHAAAKLQRWVVNESVALAHDVYSFALRVEHAQHGLVRRATFDRTAREAHTARVDAEAAVKAAHGLGKVVVVTHPAGVSTALRDRVVALEHRLTVDERRFSAQSSPIAVTAPVALPHTHGIANPWPSIHGLTRRWWRINKRLKRVEALFGAAALAVAMANVFGVSARCLRGGNVGRVMRHLCGFPKWMLDLLLLGTVEAFVLSDLCGFTDLLIRQAEAIRPGLIELVDVEDVLIGCHGTVKPLAFNLPPLSLPPMPSVSPLAA